MNNKTEEKIIQLCIEKLKEINGNSVDLTETNYVGDGCINQTMVVKTTIGKFFLKWNSSCENDMFLKEAAGLNELYSVKNPFLKIPKVIWAKEVDEHPGLLLMEYLKPSNGGINMDEKLGRGLATIHKKTANQYGFYNDNYCGATVQKNDFNHNWIDFFGQQRIWHLIELIRTTRTLSNTEINTYEKLIHKLPELLAYKTTPSLIHGDLWSGNYMYTENGPALIDPATYYADREMEFSIMTMFGGFSPKVWNAYNEEFPIEQGWQERNKIYQLYHILNHYYLFGGSYRMQAISIAERFV